MPPFLVLDACILMSGVLRPWLLTLAQSGLYEPVWSDRIGLEWRRNAARIWSLPEALLQDEWQAMNTRFPNANASARSGAHVAEPPELKHSDPKDWHVITAGYWVKREHPAHPVGVLTFNVKDFRRSELRQLGLDLWEPDRLLVSWWPDQQDVLKSTLHSVIAELVRTGRREAAPIDTFLKRDRLYRFNKLLQAQSYLGRDTPPNERPDPTR